MYSLSVVSRRPSFQLVVLLSVLRICPIAGAGSGSVSTEICRIVNMYYVVIALSELSGVAYLAAANVEVSGDMFAIRLDEIRIE
jgi:hypothetical protein